MSSLPFIGLLYYSVCGNGVVICTLHSFPPPASVPVLHVAEWWSEFMMLALLFLSVSHTIFVLLNESPGSTTELLSGTSTLQFKHCVLNFKRTIGIITRLLRPSPPRRQAHGRRLLSLVQGGCFCRPCMHHGRRHSAPVRKWECSHPYR